MWNNTRYRVKLFTDHTYNEEIAEWELNLFLRDEAIAKNVLSNAKRYRVDRIAALVHRANFHGTPYYSHFYDRQVFLKIYLPKFDISKYLW
jgi:hypothetical protein